MMVFFETPVILTVERIEHPSIRARTTSQRFPWRSLFILTIMLEHNSLSILFTCYFQIFFKVQLNVVYLPGKVSWKGIPKMDVTFSSTKLQKIYNSEKNLRSEYGHLMAEKIMVRLLDLSAASTLEMMRMLPGRCHELRSDLSGHLAVDLIHPARIVFRPNHDSDVRNESGTLIWTRVTKIIIVAITDYHK